MIDRGTHLRAEGGTPHITMRDFLAVGFRQQRLIAGTFTGIFIIVLLVAVFLPKRYESQMKILVRHERADSVVSAERNAQQPMRTEVTEEELQSEAELLKSRDLLTKVVMATDLQENQDSYWKLTPGKGAEAGAGEEKVARAVLALEKELEVRPIKLTNLISVTYRANDAREAARVLNTLANLYLEKHLAMHRVPGAFDFFHQQAEEYRSALAKSEAKLTEFGHQEGVVSPTLTREITVRKLSEFEASLHETQAAIQETEQRIHTLEAQLTSLPARHVTQVRTSDNPQLMEKLKSTLLELELKRSALLTKFEPTYRPVQEIEQQIAQARDAI